MMYGQMTAGSWIYIGTQGIVQGTYETFVEMGRQHYGGDLPGSWILTAGLGGMGGAQPLAATMAGASLLAVECQPIAHRLSPAHRLSRRRRRRTSTKRWRSSRDRRKERKAVSVGLLGNAAEVLPELVRRGVRPDIVTDQTSAHDPVNGYLPKGWSLAQWEERRASDPKGVERAAKRRWPSMCGRCSPFTRRRPDRRLRQQHPPDGARRRASRTPSTSRASCRPISARCSAAASARSAGRRCRAIRRTSSRPTPRSRN